jgi:hypothetical protein
MHAGELQHMLTGIPVLCLPHPSPTPSVTRRFTPYVLVVADKQGAAGAEDPSAAGKPRVYNVYAQPIDPANQMPSTANQLPAQGQEVPLSTERVKSAIPKGGTDADTWLYPSPQMFWNALVRKGKVEGAKEDDMDVVVAIHNNMNENTWRAVLAWEELHTEG